ncbi:MAG: ATP-binding cassette domain-containing protein [Holosporaceae bacterium]|jgi:ATP-binding cassette subfamily F protein 3|nr:ATP-binding cassette domain-containing protein [Holosporaceae bacterium]
MLTLENINFSVNGKPILDQVNLQVGNRQHIGLVGRNGSGKSTLFKIILAELEHDGGKIQREKTKTIVSVKQEMPSGDISPRDFLLSQDTVRGNLLKQLEEKSDQPELLAEIYDQLISIKAFDAESRAAVVLNGLGFDEKAQGTPLNNFSGGLRMRVALGAILFQEPDLLLLDEPTNHLDLETSGWLKDFLRAYSKSFILISHDRDFLNDVADDIMHLKNNKLTYYSGNFDKFIDAYTIKQKNLEEYNAKMETKRKHMMAFVERFGAKATKAKQAQSRLKAIAKIKFMPPDKDDPTACFNFPNPRSKLSSNILSYDKVSIGYGNVTVLKNISGLVMAEDRIAIVGANGNGKTTFAKFLAGELKQKKGTREVHGKLKVGFYKQDLFEKLDVTKSPYDFLKDMVPDQIDQQLRTHLGGFGFSGNKVFQSIEDLSGGERARLVFAALTMEAPNLLILDEPTNHLDMEMREALISSLASYGGAVILITHDRNFLNRIANSIFIVANGSVTQFNGDVDQYEKAIQSGRRSW